MEYRICIVSRRFTVVAKSKIRLDDQSVGVHPLAEH